MRNISKIILFFAIITIISGCYFAFNLPTIDKRALKSSQKINFNDVKLDVGYEFFGLRVTLFRQFYTRYDTKYSMGNVEYELVFVYYDNSPFGFDIGNNLFVDLNGNVSIKILPIFNIDLKDDFEIEILMPPYKTIYKKENDSVYVSLLKFKKRKDKWVDISFSKYHIGIDGKNANLVSSDGYEYIIEEDNEGFYLDNGLFEKKLLKTDSGYYEVYGKRLKKINYELNEESVFIQGDLMAINSQDKILVEIFNKNAQNLTIQQTSNQLFCYDINYYGTQIQFSDKEISVFENNKIIKKIKLLSHTSKL